MQTITVCKPKKQGRIVNKGGIIEKQVQRDKPWIENRFHTPYLDYGIGGVKPVFGPRFTSLYLFLYGHDQRGKPT